MKLRSDKPKEQSLISGAATSQSAVESQAPHGKQVVKAEKLSTLRCNLPAIAVDDNVVRDKSVSPRKITPAS